MDSDATRKDRIPRPPSRHLQPLRIPSGWIMEGNSFYEIDPCFETYNDASWNFSEDMLVLINKQAKVVVDLGWYPEFKANGAYRLLAVKFFSNKDKMCSSWDHPLKEIRTRSRQEVVAAIEEWLVLFNAESLSAVQINEPGG